MIRQSPYTVTIMAFASPGKVFPFFADFQAMIYPMIKKLQ